VFVRILYTKWKVKDPPGFHLDIRGSKARWAFVNGKEVSFNEGVKRAKQLLDASK